MAESDFCTHVHCPHYKQCFFFKARRKIEEAQILIVNHSLLLTQLVKGKEGVLPEVQRIIIDEAHLSCSASYKQIVKHLCGRNGNRADSDTHTLRW